MHATTLQRFGAHRGLNGAWQAVDRCRNRCLNHPCTRRACFNAALLWSMWVHPGVQAGPSGAAIAARQDQQVSSCRNPGSVACDEDSCHARLAPPDSTAQSPYTGPSRPRTQGSNMLLHGRYELEGCSCCTTLFDGTANPDRRIFPRTNACQTPVPCLVSRKKYGKDMSRWYEVKYSANAKNAVAFILLSR